MEKQNQVKYKFGGDELDLREYIENIKHNVDSYLQHQRDNNNWTNDQISEFKNAYNQYIQGLEDQYANGGDRFSTNEFGDISDSQGLLSDKDNLDTYYNDKGESISSNEYNQLKNRKKSKYNTFEANQQVATYLKKVGKRISPIKKEKPTEKFDLAKHGFLAYWANKNNPGGGPMDLKPWLESDAYDEKTGKRVVNQRALDLAADINAYKQQLKDYDFEGSSFGSKDTYIASLDNLYQKLTDGTWNNSDLKALSQAGIGTNFTNDFFTEEKDPNITPEEKKKQEADAKLAEDEKKKKELEDAKYKMVQDRYNTFLKNNYSYTDENPLNIGLMQDSGYFTPDGTFDGKAFGSAIPAGTKLTDYMNKFLLDPWSNQDLARTALAGLIGYNIAQPITDGKLKGWYYVPQTSDDATSSVLVYNPTTGTIGKTFIGNTPVWKGITDKWNIDNGVVDRYKQYASFKEGGIIPEMQLGGNVNLDALFEQDRQKRLTESAKANTLNTAYQESRTPEEQAAAERSVGIGFATENPSLEHPETGFKGTDYLRLGSIAADITSMVMSFVPGVGNVAAGATGAASSLATFAADVAEDGIGWDDFQNLGANLGMDVLGLIPGGGVSKGAKIAKQLAKYANRIIATIGTMHTLENSDKIIASYNKLISEPSKLNVDDWRNISAGLGVLTGIGGAAGRKFKQARDRKLAKEKFKTSDKVAVEMIDDKGNKQMVAFDGADAKAIKEAKDLQSLQKVTTDKFENFKGWQLATNSHYGLQTPRKDGEWRMPFRNKEGTPKVFDLTADTQGMYVNPGKWTADQRIKNIYSQQGTGNNKLETVESVDKQMLDAEKALFDPLVQGQTTINNKYTARKKTLETIKAEIDAKTSQLGTNTSDFLKKKKTDTQVEAQAIKDADLKNKLAVRQKTAEMLDIKTKDLKSINKEITRLSKKSKNKSITAAESQRLIDLTNKKELLSKEISNLNVQLNTFDAHNPDWNTWESRINTNESDVKGLSTIDQRILDAQTLEQRLKDLKGRQGKLSNWTQQVENHQIHSKAYQDLMSKIKGTGDSATIELTSPNSRRANLNLNVQEMLKKYGILYKQGGSLNLKQVRSFGGGGITNTNSTADWYQDMFNSPEMQKWFNTFNKDNYQQFNNLQDSWNTNLNATGYKPGITPLQYNQGVFNRQVLWNQTNTNPVITQLQQKGVITTKGNSGDNAQSNYQDGYFGEQEFLRHGGTKDSWAGQEDKLKAFQNELAKKGLTYTLNPENNMYYLGVIKNEEPLISSSINPSTTHSLLTQNNLSEQQENNNSLIEQTGNLASDPTLKYAIPRTMYLNARNRKLVDKAVSAEKPMLQDPFEKTRKVYGSYNDLISGTNAKASLNSLARKSVGTDMNINNAVNLESNLKGIDFENQGKMKDDSIKKESEELALQQSFENKKNRHDVAMQNRLAMLQTLKNKSQIELAGYAKNTDNNNTLASQIEQEARQKDMENKVYADSFAQKDIHNAVLYNLKDYSENLSEEELAAWNDVISGKTTPSEILADPIRGKYYKQAAIKAQQAETNQLRIYKGIPATKWQRVRNTSNNKSDDWFTLFAKDGSKLNIARIKARSKDNETFQKGIRHNQKLMDKQLGRVSKSLYGYIKSMIVK